MNIQLDKCYYPLACPMHGLFFYAFEPKSLQCVSASFIKHLKKTILFKVVSIRAIHVHAMTDD